MKTTITTLLLITLVTFQINAQAVSDVANWPNANWSLQILAHRPSSNATDIEANPMIDPCFAYDDNDSGATHNELAVVSPVIDLTAAQAAGENRITVSVDYARNYFNGMAELLEMQYWDADNAIWTQFYRFPRYDTTNASTDDYCLAQTEEVIGVLDISSFSATQLSNFQYRFHYNDDTAGDAVNLFGFSIHSPILLSSHTDAPTFMIDSFPDCTNNQFTVTINIHSLGTASTVTFSDNQGSATQTVNTTDDIYFGPYPTSTDIVITATSDQNTADMYAVPVTVRCATDACNSATALNVFDTSCGTPTLLDNTNVPDSGIPSPGCANYYGGDLWLSIVVPTSGVVSVATSSQAGSLVNNTGLAIYSGDCNNLSLIECNDNARPGTGFSQIDLTGQTAGSTLYVRTFENGNNSFGEFNICAWDPSVSAISQNTIKGFLYYPNPASNKLSLTAINTIEEVNIYNLMGQKVMTFMPNSLHVILDISKLNKGVYLVKTQVVGEFAVFKLMKK